MAGVKGKSGRKPRSDGKKMRAVNLYIPMKETYGWDDTGKKDWIPETWFLQFKKIFGPRWQSQVRKLIRLRTIEYEQRHMWECNCENRLLKWHRPQEADCQRCGYEPYEKDRYRSQQQARIHAKDEPQQKALSLCPVCKNPLTLEVDLHGRKMMRCMKC
jgi:ribosomal protein L37AE/L43A